jgi:hypothetical protein
VRDLQPTGGMVSRSRLLPVIGALILTFILYFGIRLPDAPSTTTVPSPATGASMGITFTPKNSGVSSGPPTPTAPPAEVWMDNPDEGTPAMKKTSKKKKLPASMAKRRRKQRAATVATLTKKHRLPGKASYEFGVVAWGKPRTPVWAFIAGQCPCQLPTLGTSDATRMGLKRQVSVTCEASTNPEDIDMVTIDVSMIWQLSHLPQKFHKWLCVQREPESNTPFFREWKDKCDWIASFHRSSIITILADTRTGTQLQSIPASPYQPDPSLAPICAFISNCGRTDQPDTLARVVWLQQLQHHIDVDSYGLCANNADELKWAAPEEMSTMSIPFSLFSLSCCDFRLIYSMVGYRCGSHYIEETCNATLCVCISD